jgi:hypothetical protein
MAEQKKTNESGDAAHRAERAAERGGTFKREGPDPGSGDTGTTVEEMNDKAARSVIRNVTPDEATD